MSGRKDSDWSDENLDTMRGLGDPVADRAVGAVLDRGGVSAVNDLLRTVIHADQPVPAALPDELEEYFATTLTLPDWADERKIHRGQEVFEKYGIYIALSLYCASLPSSYAAAKGVQVLHLTARLDTDTHRRVLETGQFLFDALAVGGLQPEGKGLRTIQRVRLMHAAVRHLIKARSAANPVLWNPEWGTPLNQEDMAGTLLAFSCVVITPLRGLGVRLSRREIDAYLHVWNVIGHQLGLHDDLMAHNIDEATELIGIIQGRQFKKSDEGIELAAALMKVLDKVTPGHIFDDTIPPLIRHLIGNETADMLDIPIPATPDELSFFARTADWVMVHLLGWQPGDWRRKRLMAKLARPFGFDLLKGFYGIERKGERTPFDIPDRLAAKWDIPAPAPGVVRTLEIE